MAVKKLMGRIAVLDWMSTRKKFQKQGDMLQVLGVIDLTLLGIGSMLGMGVYIMAGSLAKSVGPAMVISFVLAGLVSILSAFCYAEFAGRAPGTGSAYAYCYITVGEFIAFILGWNLVLEFVIGTACLARGLSGYVDNLVGNKISDPLQRAMPMPGNFFSKYPDFFALLIMLVFSGVISIGVRESSMVNNMVVVINLSTILALVIIGFVYGQTKNWTLDGGGTKGNGGFFPFGPARVLEGAATCFYAYTGFDTVATTGGEAKNASRAIPQALLASLMTAIIVYAAISSTFTLLWPYDDQDTDAPYAYILSQIGLSNMKWIVTVGAIAAITGSTLASVFGMARIVYSIANDGLLFSFLGKVNARTKTPVLATLVSGLFTGLLSMVFDTEQLLNMTSLGTLMAYTMVAMCVLFLRYEPNEESACLNAVEESFRGEDAGAWSLKTLLNTASSDRVTPTTSSIANFSILVFSGCSFLINTMVAVCMDRLSAGSLLHIVPTAIAGVILVIAVVILHRQPRENTALTIKVKPVPLLPLVTIFINIQLMVRLEKTTWERFFIWFFIGLIIYFTYGLWHSKERPKNSKEPGGKL